MVRRLPHDHRRTVLGHQWHWHCHHYLPCWSDDDLSDELDDSPEGFVFVVELLDDDVVVLEVDVEVVVAAEDDELCEAVVGAAGASLPDKEAAIAAASSGSSSIRSPDEICVTAGCCIKAGIDIVCPAAAATAPAAALLPVAPPVVEEAAAPATETTGTVQPNARANAVVTSLSLAGFDSCNQKNIRRLVSIDQANS